ncbi:MAG: ComF family protein [Oscillospiraceae bacterium]|jgi:competence protein ComFC
MAAKLISGLLDLLFPPRCVFCHKLLKDRERWICANCRRTLPYTTPDSAVQPGEHFSKCASALYYQGVVKDSFHRFKFSGRTNYATPYGKLMADCVRRHLADSYDLITWVPLSSKRKKKRGYDQSMLLAMAVALDLSDVAVEILRKVEERPAQSSLEGADARFDNVKDAYIITAPELVLGKRILLIDDIITTGATLSECADQLRFAGAADVVCVTLARAAPTGQAEKSDAAEDPSDRLV